MQTIGIPHSFCSYQLSDGALINVDIIDTAGQEKFKALSKGHYKKADGVLLVYDITNKETFDEIQNYFLREIKENCKEEIKIMLLGNKTDLEDERQITSDEGANFAADNGFMFLETSCLLNRNVADSFETLIELTYRDVLERNQTHLTEKPLIIDRKSRVTHKSSCC